MKDTLRISATAFDVPTSIIYLFYFGRTKLQGAAIMALRMPELGKCLL